MYITDSSLDRKKMVLQVAGANEPGTYYLYKEGSDTARILMSRHPQLDDIILSKNEKLTIKVDSETQLEAYLTLPSDNHHSTLLVYPHGGPIGVRETDYYRPEVQYLVSRGFSVLRVNFRGSSGFGKAFENKGVGQFGKLIEEDIMSAVNQVLEKHTFEHICSMGASYGGYSSAMLAIKHPDLFECVVASFGIYDLPLLFNESNVKQRDNVLKAVSNVVGEFSKELMNVSPVYLAENHKAPILLIAGRKDKVASFEHTNRFKYMLQRHGNTPETMFYDNTGHGHTNWSYDHHEAALIFDFLTRTLNLEISHLTSESESKQAIAEDYLKLADKLTFKDNVPDNNGKAFEYLQKAAHLNAPRALFNIGVNYQTGEHFEKNIDRAIAYYTKAGKLGYERAYLRLGRLYMQGYLVQQNWDLAHEYLNKAQEAKEENFAQIHLGQLYCLAPSPLQDIDRCLELLDMKQYKKKSNLLRERAYRQLEKNLAWMIIEGNYSAEDKKKIINFITEEYNITHLVAEIDNLELGVFAYGEKERYSERNEYILREDADLNKITPAKNIKIGMRFDPDVKGTDSFQHRVAMVVRWYQQTENEARVPVYSDLHFGSPKNIVWSSYQKVSDIDKNTTMTLEVYDLEKNLLLKQEFHIQAPQNDLPQLL